MNPKLPSSWQRIWGLVRQEVYVTRRRMEIIMDILFFPLMNVILFGYITHFIGTGGEVNAQYLTFGVLLWEVIVVTQYNISVSSLWSMWSRNLTNIFIAPISISEYMWSQVIASLLRTAAVVGFLALGTYFVFDFNILEVGVVNLVLFLLNLVLFAAWLGIAVLGLVFRFGLRFQSLTWYAVFFFQPLTAAFFPVSVLPGFVQAIAYALPPTYVFEAGRKALESPGIDWRYAGIALGLNLIYLTVSLVLFSRMFRRSKEVGQFARNDL